MLKNANIKITYIWYFPLDCRFHVQPESMQQLHNIIRILNNRFKHVLPKVNKQPKCLIRLKKDDKNQNKFFTHFI